jgi:trimeric autotransporter adhesin
MSALISVRGSFISSLLLAICLSQSTRSQGAQTSTAPHGKSQSSAGGADAPSVFTDANWFSMGGIAGADGEIRTAISDAQGHVYVGGSFLTIGNTQARRVAKWDGTNWSALGAGFGPPTFQSCLVAVYALAVSGTNLYAGGGLANYDCVSVGGGVARWDGKDWVGLGSGLEGHILSVTALATMGNDLYVGGLFTSAGGSPATNIAKWNGSSWSALGSGLNGRPSAIAVIGSDVYVGGNFTQAGGVPVNLIAKWNGSNWSALGSGVGDPRFTSTVYTLATSGTDLYVGGVFTIAGGLPASRIARWNGSAWSAVGTGLETSPTAMVTSGTELYAGTSSGILTRWNGTSWTSQGGGNSRIYAVAKTGSDIFVGGDFTSTTDVATRYLAIWNGNKWRAPGLGVSSEVRALAGSDTNLYAGGRYQTAGGVKSPHIAHWDGHSWRPMGSGITGPNPDVSALAMDRSTLYVGGFFTNAGGVVVTNIARWDGTNWSSVGPGLGLRTDGGVYDLAVSENGVYATGSFTNAGNIPANRIAYWNGQYWSSLGSGLTLALGASIGYVTSIALSGTNVYVGGRFDRAGGLPATNIARWNGLQWSALGVGLNNTVNDVLVVGSDLYAGGSFTAAGAMQAYGVARWDGSRWHAVGVQIDRDQFSVTSLAYSGGYLYAGGTFYDFSWPAPNRIARWNGNSWTALGSGLNASVSVLHAHGPNLYVGGAFTLAGTNVSSRVARANIGIGPGRFSTPTKNQAFGLSSTFLDGSVGQPYRIQISPSLNSRWFPYTNIIYSAPVVIPISSAGAASQFFRAVTP